MQIQMTVPIIVDGDVICEFEAAVDVKILSYVVPLHRLTAHQRIAILLKALSGKLKLFTLRYKRRMEKISLFQS